MRELTRTPVPAAALLLVLLAAVYAPGLNGPMVLDDYNNVVPLQLDELSFRALGEVAWSLDSGPLSRPLAALSFALNSYFGEQGSTFAFKATNVAIHALNALLALALVYRLCRLAGHPSPRAGTIAVCVALPWALHPLHVSATLYVVQRMATLSAGFTLVGLLLYLRMRARADPTPGRLLLDGALVCLCVLAAVFTKETGALFPVYALALEATVLAEPGARSRLAVVFGRLVRIGALVAVAVAVGYIAVTWESWGSGYHGRAFDIEQRLWSQGIALVRYIGWTFVPDTTSMTFFHDHFGPFDAGVATAAAALALAALLGYAVRHRRDRPLESLGVLVFFGAQLLESTVIPLELLFEHRHYLSMLGLMLAAAAAAVRLGAGGLPPLPARLLFAAVLVLLAVLTAARAHDWRQRVTLAHQAVVHAPSSERGWIDLATALLEKGEPDAALDVLADALTANPGAVSTALIALDMTLELGGDWPAAAERVIDTLDDGIVLPDSVMLIERILARRMVEGAEREKLEALDAILRAIRSRAEVRLNRAPRALLLAMEQNVRLRLGRPREALDAIERAMRLLPDNAEFATRLAETHLALGRHEEAARALDAARRLLGVAPGSEPERLRRIGAALAERRASRSG